MRYESESMDEKWTLSEWAYWQQTDGVLEFRFDFPHLMMPFVCCVARWFVKVDVRLVIRGRKVQKRLWGGSFGGARVLLPLLTRWQQLKGFRLKHNCLCSLLFRCLSGKASSKTGKACGQALGNTGSWYGFLLIWFMLGEVLLRKVTQMFVETAVFICS